MTKARYGALLWILCLQYFVAEAVSIQGWFGAYSLSRNYISDLGALGCGVHVAGLVSATQTLCSPLHAVMNASFCLQAVLIVAGAALLSSHFPRGAVGAVALALIGASGFGVALVGLAPEDTLPKLHFLGALENLLCCNAGMLAFGAAWLRQGRAPPRLGGLSLAFGVLGLAALVLFGAGVDLGLGVGGMERVVAYPFPIWLALIGAWAFLSSERAPAARLDAPVVADR